MNNKLVFMRLVLGDRKSAADFLDYMPWCHGGYSDKLVYATGAIDSSDDRYLLSEVFDLTTGNHTFSDEQPAQRFEALVKEEFRDSRMRKFYKLTGGEDHDVWVLVYEYLEYLNKRIAELCSDQHPYVVWLETFRNDVERHLGQILEIKDTDETDETVKFVITPVMTIPRSRFDAFMAQRHMQEGQRFGQAFFSYMDAHKCTQNKAWWDRLWNAEDMVARIMVTSLIDWQN